MLYILWTLKSIPQENKLVETPYKKKANPGYFETNKQTKKTHLFGFANFAQPGQREAENIFLMNLKS